MTSRTRITLIEDESWVARRVADTLRKDEFDVTIYKDGMLGLAGLETTPADLVLLDLGLPGMQGIDVLRRLRQRSQVPVIILTGRDDEVDAAACLTEGAADYVRKIDPDAADGKLVNRLELIARIKAALRVPLASSSKPQSVRTYGTLLIDKDRLTCEWNGKRVVLKVGPFSCLWILTDDPLRPKNRDEIKKATNVEHIEGHIKEIRSAFGDDAIETIPRIGYRLNVNFFNAEPK